MRIRRSYPNKMIYRKSGGWKIEVLFSIICRFKILKLVSTKSSLIGVSSNAKSVTNRLAQHIQLQFPESQQSSF